MGKNNKNGGVVYSTNPNYSSEEFDVEEETLPIQQQKLRLHMERAGRGGKTVTLLSGFVGCDDDRTKLSKMLKTKLGVGGNVKDDIIIIQGDVRQKIIDILKKEGYKDVK